MIVYFLVMNSKRGIISYGEFNNNVLTTCAAAQRKHTLNI